MGITEDIVNKVGSVKQVNVKNIVKKTLNGGINQPTFRHYCLLQGF